MSFARLRTKYLFSLLLLISFQQSFAQVKITGTVVDETQKAIEFANVILKEKNKFIASGITDEQGKFELETEQMGSYSLTISFVGYDDWSQTEIKQSIDLGVIHLKPATHLMEGVVVTAERAVIEMKEDKLVFNVSSSSLKENYDGMEVLERAPNIVVDNDNILIRNEAVRVMINGRNLNFSSEDLANYVRNLRSEDIKSIEVQTHLSANTDGESSAGIVNIILKKKPIGFDGNLRVNTDFREEGNYTTQPSINFNYGAEKWNIYGGARYLDMKRKSTSESDIVYYTTNDLLLEEGIWKSLRNRQNYQLGFVADANENHIFGIEFFGTNYENNYDNQSLIRLLNDGDLLDNGSANLKGLRADDLYNITANYFWTLDSLDSSLKFFADYSHQNVLGENTAISLYENGVYQDNTERNSSSSNTSIYSVQADLAKYFKHGIKLEAGSKMAYTERQNDLLSDFLQNGEWVINDRSNSFQYNEQVIAAYLSLSKKIKERNFLKIGLRMENTNLDRTDLMKKDVIQRNYTNWLPSIYFSRELSKTNTISLAYSKRLRRPPFFRINNNVIKVNDFRFELGNPDLTPEYVHKIELSFKHKKQTIAAYYNKTTDVINGIYFIEDQIAYYKPFNAGSQTQMGLDYNRFNDINKWWYIKATVGLFHRKFTDENNVDSFQRITGELSCTNIFKINETTKLDISARYHSGVSDAFYVEAENYRVNLMLQKQFLQKRLSCRIYFNDIFNTLVYASERPFADFKSTNSFKPQTRTIRLWVNYSFSNKRKINKRTNRSKNDARNRL